MNVAGRRSLSTLALCLTAGAVILASVSGWRVWFWQARSAGLEQARQQMKSRLQTLDLEVVALSAQLEAATVPGHVEGAASPPEKPSLAAADLERRITTLRTSLATARASLSELQFRGQQLDGETAHLAADLRKLTEKKSELDRRLQGASSVAQAMESELRGKDARLTPLELSVRNLRAARQSASDSIRRQVSPARAVEELERRRETYLNGILARYRQLGDQTRPFANPRPDNPAATLDLSRVQTVIGQAEETHRQIQTLDAQAALVIDRIERAR